MIRRPPRSTLFPYTDALPIYPASASTTPGGTPCASASWICPSAICGLVWKTTAPGTPALHRRAGSSAQRSEEHTSELQSRQYLVCRLLLEKKNPNENTPRPYY